MLTFIIIALCYALQSDIVKPSISRLIWLCEVFRGSIRIFQKKIRLTYIVCTKQFHYDVSVHDYNVL
jgi:hypothetical protein